MNSMQKVIKYSAMAFAIMLAIGIITAIAGVTVTVISAVTGGFSDSEDVKDFSDSFTNVKSLDIKNSNGDLTIKVGDTFKVEAENVKESFQATVTGNGTLKVDTNNNAWDWLNFMNWFGSDNSFQKAKITVYLPADFVAERTNVDTGAGRVTIESLNAEKLIINAGAGNIEGSNMTAENVEIDGGVGTVKFLNVSFYNSNMDCGVGNITVEGELLGDNMIDCGVGEVDLKLKGSEEDYNFDVDAGIGNVRINGDKVKNIKTNKGSDHSIKIDGGIGNVSIDFDKSSF